MPKLRAAVTAARLGVQRRDRRDGGGRVSAVATRPVPPPSTPAPRSSSSRQAAAWLVTADGARYLDFVAGIAVVGARPLPPGAARGRAQQLDRLWHASNLYWTEPMTMLAERLLRPLRRRSGVLLQLGSGGGRGGAQVRAQGDRPPRIVARSDDSFHGRTTLGALSATGQPAKREAFEPLLRESRSRAERRSGAAGSGRRTPAASCSSRSRAREASTARRGVRRCSTRPRRRTRRAARPRRGADRRRSDGHVLRARAGGCGRTR